MKYLIITDTHFGANRDISGYLEYQKTNFISAIDKAYEMGIRNIIHLGDLCDNNTQTPYNIQQALVDIFDYIDKHDMKMFVSVGNHDTQYKSSIDTNSFDALARKFRCIIPAYKPPKELLNDGILLTSWFQKNDTGYNDMIELTKKHNDCHTLMGHFEFNGFKYNKQGIEATRGFSTKDLKKFNNVLSGHFHERQKSGNVTYVGSAYQKTWSDYNCDRGFSIFDSSTGTLDFYNFDNIYLKCKIIDGKLMSDGEIINDLSGKIVNIDIGEYTEQQALEIIKPFGGSMLINLSSNKKVNETIKTASSTSTIDEMYKEYAMSYKDDIGEIEYVAKLLRGD